MDPNIFYNKELNYYMQIELRNKKYPWIIYKGKEYPEYPKNDARVRPILFNFQNKKYKLSGY